MRYNQWVTNQYTVSAMTGDMVSIAADETKENMTELIRALVVRAALRLVPQASFSCKRPCVGFELPMALQCLHM